MDTSSCYPVFYDDLMRTVTSPVNVYPVPASNVMTIRYTSPTFGTLRTSVYDAFGRITLSSSTQLIAGVNFISINVSILQRAVYTVVLFNEVTHEKEIRRVTVN